MGDDRCELPTPGYLGIRCREVLGLQDDWGSLVITAQRQGSRQGGNAQGPRGAVPKRRRCGCGGERNLRSRSLALGDLRGGYDPAATDQARQSRSLFSASECVAAERRQYVGKQTPGRRRCRPAPSRPSTRAARTPPRGALGQARRDRRDCVSPPPHPRHPAPSSLPLPAGARVRLRHRSSCRPPRPKEGSAVWASASAAPRLSWRRVLSFSERGSLGELQHGSEGLGADIGVPAGGPGNPESWGVSQALSPLAGLGPSPVRERETAGLGAREFRAGVPAPGLSGGQTSGRCAGCPRGARRAGGRPKANPSATKSGAWNEGSSSGFSRLFQTPARNLGRSAQVSIAQPRTEAAGRTWLEWEQHLASTDEVGLYLNAPDPDIDLLEIVLIFQASLGMGNGSGRCPGGRDRRAERPCNFRGELTGSNTAPRCPDRRPRDRRRRPDGLARVVGAPLGRPPPRAQPGPAASSTQPNATKKPGAAPIAASLKTYPSHL
uniref:Uncharacterized protein n=1 Tax=Rangifer tarandus platyrhynchus TaxID=3082113 RepID=A0ACB0EJU2_RANTA|nr:unnamed protein product [Rangifer tarandus platyrhynchus]